MIPLDRRAFLKAGLAAAGAAICPVSSSGSPDLGAGPSAPDRDSAPSASDRFSLGPGGARASLLAMGTGTNGYGGSSDQTDLGQEAFSRVIRHGLEKGLNFLDMADAYGSHAMVRRAVEGVPRSDLVLLTKMPPGPRDHVDASRVAPAIDRYRRELGTDDLDVVLLHAMTDADWPRNWESYREELTRLRAAGAIRHLGVSCHSLGALASAARHPWVEVIFARINDRGGRSHVMDGSAVEVSALLREARAAGKRVIGMKVFAAGRLATPRDMDRSLDFVFGDGLVDAVTLGMKTPAQVDDSFGRVSRALRERPR